MSQQQVAEIGIVGQVRDRSSWSSHVRWYPIDTANDAAVDITFVVPEGYTAVIGGRNKRGAASTCRDFSCRITHFPFDERLGWGGSGGFA